MREALLTAEVELEVPFQDLDPMNIAWHGNYFRYFEAARVKLLRSIGYDYPAMEASGYSWPLIEAHVRFVQALRYGQLIRVQAGLIEWENRLKLDYLVTDPVSGRRLTTGYTIQCAIEAKSGELQLVSPPALLQRLEAYL
ncbi:MAG TPA: thioesterase family protein [Gammaproteobacteria bacterium]|nr:thioesterase family protein [Gammaproteobacteria bacterium]